MGFMEFMIISPDILFPSLDIAAEIAHPEGILIWPSIFINLLPSFQNKSKKQRQPFSEQVIPALKMNVFAHAPYYTAEGVLCQSFWPIEARF